MNLTAKNPDGFESEDHGLLYSLAGARRRYDNVEDLGVKPGLYLAWTERGSFLQFAVLSFSVGGAIGGPDDGDEFCRCIVHGDGTPFDRDMRHSYWGHGDEGYLHCLGTAELVAIGTALGRWFR